MRILITGGTGFVGSHTVRALQAAGHELRLLVRSAEKVKRVFGDDAPGEIIEGDVTEATCVDRALEGAEAVVHTAAVVAMETRRAEEVLRTNLRGVELVVGGAVERGVGSIVYLSSLSALLRPGGAPIHGDSPIAEADNAYARSKADCERFVRALQREGAPVRTLYPQAIIGPDDPGLSEGNHTVMIFLRDLMVDTSGGFEIIDVRDLAAVVAALVDPAAESGRFVTPGRYLPWAQTIELMDELTGRRVRRLPVPGWMLRGLGRVGDLVKHVYPFDFPLSGEAMDTATQWPGTEASPALLDLNVDYREGAESFGDTIRWLYEAGHLEAEYAGKLAEPPAA